MPRGTFQNMYQRQRPQAEGRDRLEFLEAESAGRCEAEFQLQGTKQKKGAINLPSNPLRL